eukprot:NODE_399_length_1744_cov_40447.451917_g54_i1.p1 GENE.NODE_399_length_1744_cov_40447.451917_g54_i1~~NODE_399_length_1744_cov_40447.451917_g54_i1.p1  ORF type:complete len:496 (-),score=-60.49 NODE_399_length_1744_cov_40447.451917_g54_i1:114-1601(-)
MPLSFHLTRYLTTTGHKLVGVLYGYVGYIGGLYGFLLSMLMRLELHSLGLGSLRKVKSLYLYNGWITGHGLIMLFLFVMPVAIGGYGNYILPLLLGSSELVMPRLNGSSVWFLVAAVVIMSSAQVSFSRPACCGWTLYPPLSSRDADSASIATDLSLFTVHLLGLSSALGALNFLATFRYYRHKGLAMGSCSLFSWSIATTSLLLVGALPILGVGVTGILLDRNLCTTMFDGVLSGDPVLFQHFFWFFGHPEVYIIIIPIFGVVSVVLPSVTHRPIFGKEGMLYCMSSIGIVGFCVWAHHMFTVGLDLDTRAYFSAATGIVAIPTSVKVFSYLSSVIGSKMSMGNATVYGFWSFIICFTVGGFTGLVLSSATLDIVLHDTYFVVGHFHTVLSLGAVFGIYIGHYAFHHFWSGGTPYESIGIYQVWLTLVGTTLIFGPMHYAGVLGMARRVPEYADVFYPYMLQGSIGSIITLFSTSVLLRSIYSAGTSTPHSYYL